MAFRCWRRIADSGITILRQLHTIRIAFTGNMAIPQIQKSVVRPSRVRRIFITHLHGDHVWGLPGMMCLIGKDREGDPQKGQLIEIYGPEGVREFLRTAIEITYSKSTPSFQYATHQIHCKTGVRAHFFIFLSVIFIVVVQSPRTKGTKEGKEFSAQWGSVTYNPPVCILSTNTIKFWWKSHVTNDGNYTAGQHVR